MRLNGKTVVVLGGSSGIGLATAQRCHAEGATLVIAGRSEDKLNAARPLIGERVQSHSLDVSDELAVRKFFEQIGTLDHLFVPAAEGTLGSIAELPTEKMQASFASKFWGSLFAAKYAAPKMSTGGSITFISGLFAHKTMGGGGTIAGASNAAVESLSRSLAFELAPIRVNAILGGLIDTPSLDRLLNDKKQGVLDAVAASLPVKRVGKPEDIADAVVFLMCNGFVTGSLLYIDGGSMVL